MLEVWNKIEKPQSKINVNKPEEFHEKTKELFLWTNPEEEKTETELWVL